MQDRGIRQGRNGLFKRGEKGYKMCCKRVRTPKSRNGDRSLRRYRLQDLHTNCLTEFREHYECLEQNNHQLWQCRRPERKMNRCVFEKIVGTTSKESGGLYSQFLKGLEKTIPDSPKNQTPVHLKDKQLFADNRIVVFPWEKDVGIRKDGAKA